MFLKNSAQKVLIYLWRNNVNLKTSIPYYLLYTCFNALIYDETLLQVIMSNIFFSSASLLHIPNDGVATGSESRINGPRDSLASVAVSRQAQDRLTTLT